VAWAFAGMVKPMGQGSRASYPAEACQSDGSFGEGKARLTTAPRHQLLERDCKLSQYGARV
jgi:hypothetical protein